MPVDVGAVIAKRALALVGTPFRLHGRHAAFGLDCVGVVADVLASAGCPLAVPDDYTMRGGDVDRVSAFFGGPYFNSVNGEQFAAGDILLCAPAIRQLHFAVVVRNGTVHAHAGLRRVVLTPLPLPWPICGHWRYLGD